MSGNSSKKICTNQFNHTIQTSPSLYDALPIEHHLPTKQSSSSASDVHKCNPAGPSSVVCAQNLKDSLGLSNALCSVSLSTNVDQVVKQKLFTAEHVIPHLGNNVSQSCKSFSKPSSESAIRNADADESGVAILSTTISGDGDPLAGSVNSSIGSANALVSSGYVSVGSGSILAIGANSCNGISEGGRSLRISARVQNKQRKVEEKIDSASAASIKKVELTGNFFFNFWR